MTLLLSLCLYWDGFNSGMAEEGCKKQLEELVVMFTAIKIILPFRQGWKRNVIFFISTFFNEVGMEELRISK